jgi:hypothetical protein
MAIIRLSFLLPHTPMVIPGADQKRKKESACDLQDACNGNKQVHGEGILSGYFAGAGVQDKMRIWNFC